jgi:UDP-N-acetyl-D-glucosamine dehydrogenase
MSETLLKTIKDGNAVVGIVRLGYVGLPLVRKFARGGAKTVSKMISFDVDASKVKALKAGKSYIEHIAESEVQNIVKQDRPLRADEQSDRAGNSTFGG